MLKNEKDSYCEEFIFAGQVALLQNISYFNKKPMLFVAFSK